MKFGILYNIDYHEEIHGDPSQYYDEIIAQDVFAQKGGLLAVHVFANQVDQRGDPGGCEFGRSAGDPHERRAEPLVLLIVLLEHDRRAGCSPGVDRGNEVPQQGLLVQVVRAHRVSETNEVLSERVAIGCIDL